MATATKTRQPKQAGPDSNPSAPRTTQRSPAGGGTKLPVPDDLLDLEPDFTDERTEVLKKYASGCLNKVNENTGREAPQSSDFVAYFGASDESPDRMERLGYEPVRDEKGNHVNHRGDLLFQTPRELFTRRKARVGKRSSAVVQDQLKASDKTSAAEGFKADVPDNWR